MGAKLYHSLFSVALSILHTIHVALEINLCLKHGAEPSGTSEISDYFEGISGFDESFRIDVCETFLL